MTLPIAGLSSHVHLRLFGHFMTARLSDALAAAITTTTTTRMSLGVRISGPGIQEAYQSVLNGQEINWAILTYEKGTNDLKLQGTGDGGLEELEEEFSDGRWVLRNWYFEHKTDQDYIEYSMHSRG